MALRTDLSPPQLAIISSLPDGRIVNSYDAQTVKPDEALSEVHTRWPGTGTISLCLALMAIAATLHFIIREYYPPNIDRSKWLTAFTFLVLRNGLVGTSIGLLVRRPLLGVIIGVLVPPVLLLAIYGVPC